MPNLYRNLLDIPHLMRNPAYLLMDSCIIRYAHELTVRRNDQEGSLFLDNQTIILNYVS